MPTDEEWRFIAAYIPRLLEDVEAVRRRLAAQEPADDPPTDPIPVAGLQHVPTVPPPPPAGDTR